MRPLLNVTALLFICCQTRAQDLSWHYRKDDPATKKRVVQIDAHSSEQIKDGTGKFLLRDMTARLYDASGSTYKQIRSKQAIVDEKLGTLAYGSGLKTVIRLSN
jgi:hypothetical protein